MRDILTAVRDGRLDPSTAGRLLEDPSLPDPGAEARPVEPGPEAGTDQVGPVTTTGEKAEVGEPDRDGSGEPAGDPENDGASPGVWAVVTDDPTSRGRGRGADESGASADTARTPARTAHADADADARATTSVRVRAMTRRVRILADPAVQTVSVDGPHELRREGTVLVLESDRDLPFGDPFAFLPSMRGGFRLQPPTGLPFSLGADLVVRLNPAIDLDVDVTAGSLSVRGVGRVRARVTAGSARIEEVGGPLDLHVVGGTARIDTTVRGGDNRIRCDSGSLVLRLRRDSDVRLRPDAQLGRIVIDGAEGGREIVVGAGTGRLDVEVVMGSLQVEVER